jgi:hypothetical protein
MATVWTYDGAHTIDVTFEMEGDASFLREFELIERDDNGGIEFNDPVGTPESSSSTFEHAAYSAGDIIAAALFYSVRIHNTTYGNYDSYLFSEIRYFVYGTAGAGVSAESLGYTYTYDGGTNLDVTLIITKQMQGGVYLTADDPNSSGDFTYVSSSPGSQGSLVTLHITDIGGLAAGDEFNFQCHEPLSGYYSYIGLPHVNPVFGTPSSYPSGPAAYTDSDTIPVTVSPSVDESLDDGRVVPVKVSPAGVGVFAAVETGGVIYVDVRFGDVECYNTATPDFRVEDFNKWLVDGQNKWHSTEVGNRWSVYEVLGDFDNSCFAETVS